MKAAMRIILLLIASLSAACNRDLSMPVTIPQEFSATGRGEAPDMWWRAFGDRVLDGLVADAMKGNMTLRMAWDRLDQARAAVQASGSFLWPQIDVDGAGSRTMTSSRVWGRGGGIERMAAYQNDFSMGVLAWYEIDLWGRLRANRDAAILDYGATREDVRAAGMTLSAEVAGTWYALLELRGQLELLAEQVETNEDYLELITLRFRRGQVFAADVLRQQEFVEQTRAGRILVESSRKVLEHRLGILLGRAPSGFGQLKGEVPSGLPPLPETGLPVDLVSRRPDVRAARMRLEAADHRVAAAMADRLPRISVSVGADTSAARIRDLFDNFLASLAANLVAPLFDAGRRAAEVDRTKAVVSERLHAWGGAVLNALREVEDALVSEARQREYIKNLEQQMELSGKVLERTRENYTKGAADYLRVLESLQSHQRLQRTLLTARRNLVQFRIDLYRALGGGWDMVCGGE